MKYYDKSTHTETNVESETTIPATDSRVKDFFRALKENEYVVYIDDLPVIKELENYDTRTI